MKKSLYIFAFGLLGLVLATIMHAAVEIIALEIIFGSPETYADTVWWQEWHAIHGVFSFLLWLIGFVLGAQYGMKWWEPHGSKPGFYHWKKTKSVNNL